MLWKRKRVRKRVLAPADRRRREEARAAITARVERWAAVMNIVPKRIAIRDQRSRWGSASVLGNLNFNWRIVRMPKPIQDYIVIHELAHLKEMNHSPAFWAIVAEYCPHFKTHRAWLRKNGHAYHRRVI